MPQNYRDLVNLILRDHQGYDGDGEGGRGTLPKGDTSTARKPIDKRDLREVFLASGNAGEVAMGAADAADAARKAAELARDVAEGVVEILGSPVSYAPQDLNIDQRGQAHVNLGLGDLARKDMTELYPRDLNDLDINDLPAGGGVAAFPTTLEEELRDHFSGGNPDGTLPNIASQDLGNILFMMPSEDRTSFVAADTPWQTYKGITRRMIPLDIRTQIPGLSIARPLFRPRLTNEFGLLVWEYIGKTPLHTTIEGSFSTLIKTSLQQDDSYAGFILSLDVWGAPDIALGQGGGAQFLSISSSGTDGPRALRDTLEYWDIGQPWSPARQSSAAVWPNLFTGAVPGYFNANTPVDVDTIEAAKPKTYQYNGDDLVVQEYVTNWMDLTAMGGGSPPANETAFLFYPAATMPHFTEVLCATYGYVQYRMADGKIRYLAQQSENRTPFRCYYLPKGAVAVRLSFNAIQLVDLDYDFHFSRMGSNHSAEFSPLHGKFVEANFSVISDVVFYPGCEYALTFRAQVYDGAFNRSNGFRYQGGGLKASFPAGGMRKSLSQNLMRR